MDALGNIHFTDAHLKMPTIWMWFETCSTKF